MPRLTGARSRWLAPVVAYGAATLAFTWPLALRFVTAIAGAPGDNMIFYWNLWWFREALWRRHVAPFHTPLLFHPDGADLAYHTTTLLGTLPGAALALFLPLPVAFNLVFVGCFLTTALVVHGLALHVLRRAGHGGAGAGWLAGFAALAYAFAPFHFAHVGHLNILNVAAVPLTAWMLLRLWERPTPLRGVALGAALGAAALADGYHVLAALLLVAWLAVLLRGRDAPQAPRATRAAGASPATGAAHAPGAALARYARVAMSCLVTFLLVASPVLVPMWRYGTRGLEDVQAGGANDYVADVVSWILPSPFHPLWGAALDPLYARLSGNQAESVVFPTLTVLCLAGFGWRRAGREARLWAWVAVGFAVLSLGPFLHVAGHSAIEIGAGRFLRLPLPKLFLDALPLLSGARAAGRFASVAQLGLVLCAMLGLGSIAAAKTRGGGTRRGPILLAIAGVTCECLAWPLPTTPVDVPAAYHVLAADARAHGGHGALLEIPPVHGGDKVYQLYQTVHGLPLLGGRLARGPRHAFDRLHRDPFIDRTISRDPWRANDGLLSLDGLDSLGVGYVMLHERLRASGAIERVLEPHFEAVPVPGDGDERLFRRRVPARKP